MNTTKKPEPKKPDPKPKPRIDLALGGGGAKGFVHVGVIQALVDHGYEIASITGTSVGALVGSVFAYNRAIWGKGKDVHTAQKEAAAGLRDLCLTTDFEHFKDLNWWSLLRAAVYKGDKLGNWLGTQLLDQDPTRPQPISFFDLPFDLTVTATDALNGDSLVLNRAESPAITVAAAVRASISIQGAFKDTAVEYHGKLLNCWDGGSTGNCRFDLALARNPKNLTVASSLTYRGTVTFTGASFLTAYKRPLKLFSHSAGILMRQLEQTAYDGLSAEQKARLILIRPVVGAVDTLQFGLSASEKNGLFENGRIAIEQELERLQSP